FPTFATQHFAFHAHGVLTAGDTAPPQRFAYLGGAGTLPTLDVLSLGGDHRAARRIRVGGGRRPAEVRAEPRRTARFLVLLRRLRFRSAHAPRRGELRGQGPRAALERVLSGGFGRLPPPHP